MHLRGAYIAIHSKSNNSPHLIILNQPPTIIWSRSLTVNMMRLELWIIRIEFGISSNSVVENAMPHGNILRHTEKHIKALDDIYLFKHCEDLGWTWSFLLKDVERQDWHVGARTTTTLKRREIQLAVPLILLAWRSLETVQVQSTVEKSASCNATQTRPSPNFQSCLEIPERNVASGIQIQGFHDATTSTPR